MIRTRAQESRAAIERLYTSMRHLFNRGSYKPLGVSGESMIEALLTLRPEIYGAVVDPEKVELDGLLYVMERLPSGIEECQFIRLISREGYENSGFKTLIPAKRRRNCYRVDAEQMYVEMTRGRSDIYDILTHLTFLYIESEKIRRNSTDHKGKESINWQKLRQVVQLEAKGEPFDLESASTYLSHIIGRTFKETLEAVKKFEKSYTNSLFSIVYHLGNLSIREKNEEKDREIFFSATLRERVGHHVYGERWAEHIKGFLVDKNLTDRPYHIISANLHSVLNTIYGTHVEGFPNFKELENFAAKLSQPAGEKKQKLINDYAKKHGFYELQDTTGTNIGVQIIDTAFLKNKTLAPQVTLKDTEKGLEPVIIVMDYAFGEQAYECMDELLKPFVLEGKNKRMNVVSVSIMGKAGILQGGKGDLMIPNAHVFEGTADNYPIKNELTGKDFQGFGLGVYEGSMITVLGTSLQNKDILKYFMDSSWGAVGLEMEGAHYHKAIQSSAKIRSSITKNVKTLYAYYASDNPLETGSTLASGSLGLDGVKPTYLITHKILEKIASF
ncbi:MAG: DUF6909 family protein [Luteibaculaceae bacterium]